MIDDPGNVCFGEAVAQRGQHRQGVDDVAQGARLDQDDAPGNVVTKGKTVWSEQHGGESFHHEGGTSAAADARQQRQHNQQQRRAEQVGQQVRCGHLVKRQADEWAKDAAKFQRLMQALMQMKKIDIAALERAYNQAPPDR